MVTATNHTLAGRCGKYCGACAIYRAYKDGGKLRVDVARTYRCLPSELRCDGCRTLHIVGWSREPDRGRNCRVLRCLKTQNLETCGDCRQQRECDIWKAVAASCRSSGIDLGANLRSQREQGIDRWLASQAERWRCQHCSKPVAASADNPRCPSCGNFQL